MTTDTLRIDGDRLLARLTELAAIGATADGACCRLALTDEDRAGRDLVCRWMRELGLQVHVDPIGNIFGWRAGTEDAAPVMTGSHIDTVRTGGRYDGCLGVLGGLEVVRTLNDAGVRTRRPLVVGVFTNEEGARFAPDMLGSLVYAGGLPLADALDRTGIDGRRLGDELERIGYAGDAALPLVRPQAYRRAAHRAGPGARRRGHHDRCGREPAGHLVAGTEHRRPGQPRRHHADAAAPRRRLCRGGDRRLRAHAGARARRQPGRHGGLAEPAPEPDQRDRRAGER